MTDEENPTDHTSECRLDEFASDIFSRSLREQIEAILHRLRNSSLEYLEKIPSEPGFADVHVEQQREDRRDLNRTISDVSGGSRQGGLSDEKLADLLFDPNIRQGYLEQRVYTKLTREIKRWPMKAGLTRDQLSQRTGMDISRVERPENVRYLQIIRLQQIAAGCGVRLEITGVETW